MVKLQAFNPLKYAIAPRSQRYSSLEAYSLNDDDSSSEKEGPLLGHPGSLHRSPSWDESSSLGSSRATSDSYQPTAPPRRSPFLSNICLRILPNRTTRYLSLVLVSTMLILILSLIRMSVVSSRRVEVEPLQSKDPPAQWDHFPFLGRYYGGIRSLVARAENVPEYPRVVEDAPPSGSSDTNEPKVDRRSDAMPSSGPFNPYPDYASVEYASEYGSFVDCQQNITLNARIPSVRAYDGIPRGFPDPAMGSYSVLGLRNDICFEKYGRLGPYGYGYSVKAGGTGAGLHGDREGAEEVWGDSAPVNFNGVNWAQLQTQCVAANKHRFAEIPERQIDHAFQMGVGPSAILTKRDLVDTNATSSVVHQEQLNDTHSVPVSDPGENGSETTPSYSNTPKPDQEPSQPSTNQFGKKRTPRTAFLVRTWESYEYTTDDILYLRALISELSLMSGGEYTVHLLVHVRDVNLQIWADEELYQETLRKSLPEEFWGLGTLWTERQMGLIYGGLEETFYAKLPVHGVYRGTFMPVQWFAHQHPEYDYFWEWEMDVRYTGHYYHLLDRVGKWASDQPRKGLWERSSRFYVPAVHDTWEDFKQMVRWQTEMGTDSPSNVWSGLQTGHSTSRGDRGKSDKPIWGPERPPNDQLNTTFDEIPPTSYEKDKYQWGVGEEADLITFNPMFDPDGTTWNLAQDTTGYNTSEGLPPRRSAIVTASRLSKKLLQTMHHETSIMRHHMFSEMWPASCALHHGFKAVYAPHPVFVDRDWPPQYLASVFNGGRNGATGGARTSVFGSREHNFRGTSWYYNAGFAPNLYKRWLGFRVDNGGGEEAEMAGDGRMCLPGVLLHPVKNVHMGVEGNVGNVESD
ncbi:MAG: hypothetical protein M1833_003185 [Piccolia ochrophora]|nr:MAG: hypothetical protein M1833_003185 [Piccolia ochrophora]